MIIYSHITSPRLQYIAGFLTRYFQHTFTIRTEGGVLSNATEPVICYAEVCHHPEAFWIKPHGLMFQKGIRDIPVKCSKHPSGYTTFFQNEGHLSFDLFSAIFYLLSRYEEYLPYQKDEYGRYAHTNSVAFKNNFLHQPVINIWLEDFRKKLLEKTNYQLPTTKFTFLPTYDIDMAWSYKGKGFLRNSCGLIRSVIRGRGAEVKERLAVLTNQKPDPYDAFEWMDEVHQKHNLKPIYFFHVGEQRNRYDKNISTTNKDFRQLIKRIATIYKTGLHPSWHSGDEETYLRKEKEVIEEITGKKITASRQHYIRFALPQTFRRLIKASIKEDYSMGYGTINGFRASIAHSFYWYDLEKEEATSLLLHPFCFMDANAYHEQRQNIEGTRAELQQYYQTVKAVNGMLCTLWHNTFLGSDPLFQGWKELYEGFVKKVSND